MKSVWFQGLKPEEQESFKKDVLSAQKVLDKLTKIVYNRTIEVQNTPIADYDCASWSHRQAHQNGQVAAFKEILSLIDIKV